MENYLVINGKRVDLTEEQIEKLGLKVKKKSYFNRVKKSDTFYSIYETGTITLTREDGYLGCSRLYQTGNYCTNKELITERAKEEVLSRLLWRFSMENGGSEIDWKDNIQKKYFIYKNIVQQEWITIYNSTNPCLGLVYFISQEIAQRAIDEIVKPFYAGELEVCKIWEE